MAQKGMQPKLLMDAKLEKGHDAYAKFGEAVDEFHKATTNMDKWDAFSKADRLFGVAQKRVGHSNQMKEVREELKAVAKSKKPTYETKVV